MSDPLDFSALYNTALSDDEEAAFQQWLQGESERIGRDLSKDLYDYDVRGWWKALMSGETKTDERGHGSDRWKKPNHISFSDQSMYHGVDGYTGGSWGEGVYTPSESVMSMHGNGRIQDYFRRNEPQTRLYIKPEMMGRALPPDQSSVVQKMFSFAAPKPGVAK